MKDHIYGCPCCSPLIGDAFKAAKRRALIDQGVDAGEVALLPLGTIVDRRTVLKTGAAFAGAAAAVAFHSQPASAQNSDTTIFHNGTILTVDSDFSEAEAIAVRGEKILAVGSEAQVRKKAGSKAKLIDLQGQVMLPGFVEPHTHVVTGAVLASIAEYVGIARFSKTSEVLAHLKGLAETKKPGEWITARNWDPSVQEGPDALTFKELDEVSTNNPVFVLNASGHLAYANSEAFKAAKVADDVEDPPGGVWVRDSAGKLNGTMKNMAAFISVFAANPGMQSMDPVKALVDLLAKWSEVGLTTVSELALGTLTSGPGDMDVLQAAAATGKLQARLRVYPQYLFEDKWLKAGTKPGEGDPLVRVAGYKLVADGSNQGFTGLQREPYLGTNSFGIAYTEPDELRRMCLERTKEGWQLAIHGNGDKAIDNLLDALQATKDAGLDVSKLRPRIEHCSILHDDQIARMKQLGISASFLIGHVHYWGVAMRDRVFGEDKAKLLDRCASVEKAGVGYSLHSDFTVTDPVPLHMIEMAVTRRLTAEPDYVLAPGERVPVESAIRAVTSEAAWQLNSDHEVGTLEVGKFADLVILDKDPRKVDPNTIKAIKVTETWMNGKRVYNDNA